jgi:DNA-binding MltR family transcriptional regulator
MQLFPTERLEEVFGWLAKLQRSDKRLLLIMAASKLDEMLKAKLKSMLVPDACKVDPVFEWKGPLGSFSSRIMLAHRLGLIDAKFEKYLNLVRKMRNDAAHASEHFEIDKPPFSDRAREVLSLVKESGFIDCTIKGLGSAATVPETLTLSLVAGILVLEIANLSTKRFSVEPVGFSNVATTDELRE